MKRGLFSAFFLALLIGLAAVPVAAQPRHGQNGVQPLDKLLPKIRRQHPGTIYDAEGPTRGPDGDPRYRLKWMTPDGRVIWLDTDARNGRVLDTSPRRPRGDPGAFRGSPPAYQQFGQPGARDPYEDDYRSRYGGRFDSRYDGDRHGPRFQGPRAGDFGRRGVGPGQRHR